MPPKYILRCSPLGSTAWLATILNARSWSLFRLNKATVSSISFCEVSFSALNFLCKKYLFSISLTALGSVFLGGQSLGLLSFILSAWASLASMSSWRLSSSTFFHSLLTIFSSTTSLFTLGLLTPSPWDGRFQPELSNIAAASLNLLSRSFQALSSYSTSLCCKATISSLRMGNSMSST